MFNERAQRLRRELAQPLRFKLFLLGKLPLALCAGLRLERLDEQECRVGLPGGWRTRNPFGSTYFAAQAMAAEMSTGAPALILARAAPRSVALILVGIRATFHKRIVGRSSYSFTDMAALARTIDLACAQDDPMTFTARSTALGPDGTCCSTFDVEWSFKRPEMSTTGFVVAGGRSRRMGRDKALLPWGDATLLDHALLRLREVTDDVRILCGRELRYFERAAPLVTDSFPETGPLVAVASGLLAANRPLVLALAVDLPRVPVALLRLLIEMAGDADVVVPSLPRGPEPLCAVYRRTCLAPVEAAIERADFKMTSFWPEVRVRPVEQDVLSAFGDPDTLFANVNAPQDYQRARVWQERP